MNQARSGELLFTQYNNFFSKQNNGYKFSFANFQFSWRKLHLHTIIFVALGLEKLFWKDVRKNASLDKLLTVISYSLSKTKPKEKKNKGNSKKIILFILSYPFFFSNFYFFFILLRSLLPFAQVRRLLKKLAFTNLVVYTASINPYSLPPWWIIVKYYLNGAQHTLK